MWIDFWGFYFFVKNPKNYVFKTHFYGHTPEIIALAKQKVRL